MSVKRFASYDGYIPLDVLDAAAEWCGPELSYTVDNHGAAVAVTADEVDAYLQGKAHPLMPSGIKTVSSVVYYWLTLGCHVHVYGHDWAEGRPDGPYHLDNVYDHVPDYAHYHCPTSADVTFGVGRWSRLDHEDTHSYEHICNVEDQQPCETLTCLTPSLSLV